MRIKKLSVLTVAFMFIFALCFAVISPTAYAVLSKKGSISVHVADSKTGEPLESAVFRLYFFASAHEKEDGLGYEYVFPYEECKMDMNNLEDAYLPVHLTYFATTNSLPYTEKMSDSSGRLVFDELVPGVYLLVPVNNVKNYLMPSPFVINLPVFDEKDEIWQYDIDATPKMQADEWTDNYEGTYISVKKVWDTTTEHPDEITVSLLRDLQEVEKVVLNESNNWYYRWDDLPKNHSWNVVESAVPDGYRVSYEASEHFVNITNSLYIPEDEPATTPHDTTVPEQVPDTTVEQPGTTVPSSGTTNPVETEPSHSTTKPVTAPTQPTTKPEELIDTGQLNWPIPLFSIAGLLLFSLGWAMLNFGKKENT